MTQDESVTLVGSKTARCGGAPDRLHDPVEIVLVGAGVANCPSCGRRFRRIETVGSVNPAAWPKDE